MLAALALFSILVVPGAWAAQAVDFPFGSGEEDLFFFDEEAFFGGGLLREVEEPAQSAGTLDAAFLVRERIEFGGDYRLALEASAAWEDGGIAAANRSLVASMGGSLFADFRPRRDFRLFAKGKGNASVIDGVAEGPAFRLHELFADIDVGDKAFVRAGKQTVNWGVGYFFSPADIINIGRIDPERPEAEREGPIAVRVHVPSGKNNYYAYALVAGADDAAVAFAPKAEFVLGRSEVGVGLYYRADRVPRVMATVSTSLGRTSLFAEAVVSKGSDKRFVKSVPMSPENPFGLEVIRDSESLFAHFTAGVRYTYNDPDRRYSLTGAGQYYYNGEGYEGRFAAENRLAMGALLATGELLPADMLSTGRHYAAATVVATGRSLGDFSPSLFWLGNLGDGSGMVTLSVAYNRWNSVRPSVSFTQWYGDSGGEYAAPFGLNNRVALSLSVAQSF